MSASRSVSERGEDQVGSDEDLTLSSSSSRATRPRLGSSSSSSKGGAPMTDTAASGDRSLIFRSYRWPPQGTDSQSPRLRHECCRDGQAGRGAWAQCRMHRRGGEDALQPHAARSKAAGQQGSKEAVQQGSSRSRLQQGGLEHAPDVLSHVCLEGGRARLEHRSLACSGRDGNAPGMGGGRGKRWVSERASERGALRHGMALGTAPSSQRSAQQPCALDS